MKHLMEKALTPTLVRPLTQERMLEISRIEDVRNVLIRDALRDMLAGAKIEPGKLSVRLAPSLSRFVAR
jgi:hypothetical protein